MAALHNKGQYVSRAGLKLASVAGALQLDFNGKVVLDVGSSTGGFTDYALQYGAKRVIAVELGTNQLHPSLRINPKVELHEKTDVRDFHIPKSAKLPTIIVVDISFMSLRDVLPHIAKNLCDIDTQIIAMVKPQFEAKNQQLNKGIVKNESMRRDIFKNFEAWAKELFVIQAKADSIISGTKGNQERFYLLKILNAA